MQRINRKKRSSVELYQEICSSKSSTWKLRENAYIEIVATMRYELIQNDGKSELLDIFVRRWLEYLKNKKGGGVLYEQIRELELKAIKIIEYSGEDYKEICNSTWDILAILEGLYILFHPLVEKIDIVNCADYFARFLFMKSSTISILLDATPILKLKHPRINNQYSDYSLLTALVKIDTELSIYFEKVKFAKNEQNLKTELEKVRKEKETSELKARKEREQLMLKLDKAKKEIGDTQEQLLAEKAKFKAELEKAKTEQIRAEEERKKQAVLNEIKRKKELEAMQKIATEKAERDAQEKLHAEKAKLEAELEKARKEQAEAEEERKRQVALNEVRRKKELEAIQKIATEKAERDAQEKLRTKKAKLEAELEKARNEQAKAEEELKRQAALNEIRRKKELEAIKKEADEKAKREAHEKELEEIAQLEIELEKTIAERAKAEEEYKKQSILNNERHQKELEAVKKEAVESVEKMWKKNSMQ